MKRSLAISALLLVSIAASLTAFAGKKERDFMTNEVTPAVKKASETFTASCGCALPITVSDTLASVVDDMRQARSIANAIKDGAPKYCNDAESKKAMCAMKSLDIVKGAKTAFAFKDGKGTATTDGKSYVSWNMITREIDK
jgi:hypothetical protein